MIRDLGYTFRVLRRTPGYALICVTILALGIGANSAIFSVLDSVILKALPYPDPARLVFVWERFPNMPPPVDKRMDVAYKNFVEWRRQNRVFTDMAAFRAVTLDETNLEHPRKVSAGFASPGLFPLLGVQARIGRLFTTEEERAGSDTVAVLTSRYFDLRFNQNPAAIGRSITLGGTSYTVIGVLPTAFHLPSTHEGSDQLKPEVWLPLSRLIRTEADQTARQLRVAARLKPDATLAEARTEMAGIAARLWKAESKLDDGWTTSVFPVETEETEPRLHQAIYVLMGAVGFLLLIACANLANLTLARATLRSREIALRLALGATRGRIVAQLVSESLLLSIAGAAFGLLLADWCIGMMLALKPDSIQRPELIGINTTVFAFTAAVSVVTAVLFGLAPSLAASRMDLNMALKTGGWGASPARLRSRQFLIALETALALVLLVGAGLMIRSFQEILSVGLGFETRSITVADVELPDKRYPDDDARLQFCRRLMDEAGAIPGVDAVAMADNLPLHSISMSNFYIASRPEPSISSLPIADMARVSPGYFDVIGLRLESGRVFTAADVSRRRDDPESVAIVNRAFARHFFPDENPLGRRLLSSDKKQSSEIVGIVSDYRSMGVENGTRPTIFWASLSLPAGTLVVRSPLPAETLAMAIRSAIWAVDRELPAAEVRSMKHYVDGWLSQRKFTTLLLGTFAGLALVLGMVGIYGVLSNLVASRIREIGIRMAIGASRGEIGRLLLRQGMIPVAIGLAAGLAGSLALGRFLESLLFEVRARDPVTLILAAATILLVSPAAIYLPMHRATRVDCTVALRDE
jgi:putative ABC transport system permease protein